MRNLDGEFNSGDFVAVFSVGKYETGVKASWSEGDWNADGVFDSGDFVRAFVDSGYEVGRRPALAVPESEGGPMSLSLAMIVFGIARRTRKQS